MKERGHCGRGGGGAGERGDVGEGAGGRQVSEARGVEAGAGAGCKVGGHFAEERPVELWPSLSLTEPTAIQSKGLVVKISGRILAKIGQLVVKFWPAQRHLAEAGGHGVARWWNFD